MIIFFLFINYLCTFFKLKTILSLTLLNLIILNLKINIINTTNSRGAWQQGVPAEPAAFQILFSRSMVHYSYLQYKYDRDNLITLSIVCKSYSRFEMFCGTWLCGIQCFWCWHITHRYSTHMLLNVQEYLATAWAQLSYAAPGDRSNFHNLHQNL